MPFWNSIYSAPVQSHKFHVDFPGVASYVVKSVTKPSVEVSEGVFQAGNHKFKYPGVHTWNDVTITFVDNKETTRRMIQKFLGQGWLNPTGEASEFGFDMPAPPVDQSGIPQGIVVTDSFVQTGILPIPTAGDRTSDGHIKEKIGKIHIYQHASFMKLGLVEKEEGGLLDSAVSAIGNFMGAPSLEPRYKRSSIRATLEQWTLNGAWIKSINFGQLDYSSDELITIELVIAYDYATVFFPDEGLMVDMDKA